ncbi:MAG: hypothetical protein LUC50_04100 [Ruminococcus sp.]|nr:hypothetical protein [Ruminococcus sp.]
MHGDTLTVAFDYAAQGLCWHGAPEGFELAGSDGIYHSAQAVLDGERVYLTCAAAPKPMTACYAWYNYGAVTLFGTNGIPAAPFRTEPPLLPLLST